MQKTPKINVLKRKTTLKEPFKKFLILLSRPIPSATKNETPPEKLKRNVMNRLISQSGKSKFSQNEYGAPHVKYNGGVTMKNRNAAKNFSFILFLPPIFFYKFRRICLYRKGSFRWLLLRRYPQRRRSVKFLRRPRLS